MKTNRIIQLWLLMLLTVLMATAFGQTKKKVPQDTVATRAWVRQYVKSMQKPIVPAVTQPDCKVGLTLLSIDTSRANRLTVEFNAVDVDSIDYEISKDSVVNQKYKVRQVIQKGNSGKLTSSRFVIPHSLSTGNYRLLIRASNCNASSIKAFMIGLSDIRPDCVAGLSLLSVVRVENHLEATFHSLDVESIDYQVMRNNAVVHSGTTGQLTSSKFQINYLPTSGSYELKIQAKNCKSDPKTGVKTFQIASIPAPSLQVPKIIYYNYDDTGEALSAIKLSVERKADGKIYLKDDGVMPYISRYAVNGSTNRLNPSQLSKQPMPAGEWIHLVKFVSDVTNINTDGWQTSTQLSGSLTGRKFAASFECTFYIEDGTRPALKYTQPLWSNQPQRDGLSLSQTPAFTLKNKLYGSESKPSETDEQLRNISWTSGSNGYQLLYAGEVKNLTDRLNNGITYLNDSELERAADLLASMAGSARYFAVDFEPADPAADAWRWNYEAGNFRQVMQKLSKRIFEKHGKYFYSWIGKGNRFSFRDKTIELDGYGNADWGTSPDTYIALHENPSEIKNVELASKLTQVGFGYNSITIAADVTQPASKWVSPTMWYLRTLDVLNVQTLITPKDEKLLLFLWPFEDQPMDAKRTPMTRLKLGQGYVKQVNNRVQFAHNLVRDGILTYLCNPKHIYTQYWLFGTSYDPAAMLRWSKINGQLSCLSKVSNGFFVSEYTGSDTPACPTIQDDYIGKDALSVSAMVQAHEVFAKELQDVLDGSQVREMLEFTRYTRSNSGITETQTPVHKNDTGEFARAYKYGQPWVQLWKNPATGKRVLLYQDVYAEAFEAGSFSVVIDGQTITRQTNGNRLFYEVL